MVKRNTSRRQNRRRQRGGGDESLAQGREFEKYHMNQHGGYSEMPGAPLDYTGELDQSMRADARVAQYDAHFRDAAAQRGGSRRRRQNKSRRQSKNKRSSKNKNRSRRQSQRGGYSPAAASAPYTLLTDYRGTGIMAPPATPSLVPYTVIGGDHARSSPSTMQGGNRSRSRRNKRNQKSRSQKSRNNRRQRGGYSPIGAPTMLLSESEYNKAAIHHDFRDPLLLK
jgi:hypothetical protein